MHDGRIQVIFKQFDRRLGGYTYLRLCAGRAVTWSEIQTLIEDRYAHPDGYWWTRRRWYDPEVDEALKKVPCPFHPESKSHIELVALPKGVRDTIGVIKTP
jgi:hypothetical protein